MANFENGFYEAHAVKVNEQKLSEKFHVAYTPEGSTPDGYHVYESLTIETGKGAIDISRDSSAVYMSGGNETERSMTEAYNMIGIDTDSKEFKQFQKDIQKPENYNAQTVEKMLETVPQLTAEKQVEILNTFSYENEREHLHEEIVSEINRELVEKGHNKIELAEPGRQYTGEITSIDEERTTQVTKSGVTIIHETQNLPGIQEKEVGKSVKIDYANGKEATIEDKSSGLERGKEAKLEHDHQAERLHDSGDHDHDIPF